MRSENCATDDSSAEQNRLNCLAKALRRVGRRLRLGSGEGGGATRPKGAAVFRLSRGIERGDRGASDSIADRCITWVILHPQAAGRSLFPTATYDVQSRSTNRFIAICLSPADSPRWLWNILVLQSDTRFADVIKTSREINALIRIYPFLRPLVRTQNDGWSNTCAGRVSFIARYRIVSRLRLSLVALLDRPLLLMI